MRVILALIFMGLFFGCIGGKECAKGYIKSGSECCLDDNANGVCDDQELEKLVLVVKTPPASCEDTVQNQGETGVDCGGPCGPCPTPTTQPRRADDNEGVRNITYSDRTTSGRGNGSIRDIIPSDRTGSEWGNNRSNTNSTAMGGESEGGDLSLVESGADEGGNISTNASAQTTAEEILLETLNSSFCAESKQYLTATAQDGYVGDESEPLDGVGDKVVSSAYNMVGDAADSGKNASRTKDRRYKTIMAIPIGGLTRAVSDARINILLSGKAGDVADTQVEHINCTGTVRKEDYSSPSDGYAGKIMTASDKAEMYYGIDVSEFIQRDIESKLKYSCYRFFWNDSQMERISDKKTQRIIFEGYGSEYAPYLSYIKRPCVRCKMNADCGETQYITDYQCNDFTVLRQYLHYRCAQPETENARCVITQDADIVDRCSPNEACVAGEDRCLPETCFDGIKNGAEDRTDCGGKCRPCSCFNRRKDTKDSIGNDSIVEEKGVDCGGDCKPCPTDLRILKVKVISPSSKEVYDSRQVGWRYSANKNTEACWYSVNGEANKTLRGAEKIITAVEGENNLTFYCNDSLGQYDVDSVRFNVESEYIACRTDKTKLNYTRGFDRAVFFSDNSSTANITGACSKDLFLKASAQNDSIKHNFGPFDATKPLKDKLFKEVKGAGLIFACEDRVDYQAGYAHLSKVITPSNTTKLGIIAYFSENGTVNRRDTFWRFYFYRRNKNTVKNDTYLDIPYLPLYSSCDNESGMRYQELDLTPLAGNMTFSGEGSIELRMGVYSKHPGVRLDLREMRLLVR